MRVRKVSRMSTGSWNCRDGHWVRPLMEIHSRAIAYLDVDQTPDILPTSPDGRQKLEQLLNPRNRLRRRLLAHEMLHISVPIPLPNSSPPSRTPIQSRVMAQDDLSVLRPLNVSLDCRSSTFQSLSKSPDRVFWEPSGETWSGASKPEGGAGETVSSCVVSFARLNRISSSSSAPR